MDRYSFKEAIRRISRKIDENKNYLIQLDQQNGDGDLGISMSEGFGATLLLLEITEEDDLGKLCMKLGNAFNEAAPSSLGTILSFGFMGMARQLKGKTEVGPQEMALAFQAGVDKIMEKTGSKMGERTVLDALCPAITVCKEAIETGENWNTAIKKAAKASAQGAENTRNMKPVHGRAAYYGEKSLGHLDGGAVVGQLIFEALSE